MSPNKNFAAGADQARAAIFSVSGPELSAEERDFFAESNPFGFILFARNCEEPAQLRKLTDGLKEAVGRDCPILIDQEGGRVQRLKTHYWRDYPPMRQFGEIAEEDMDTALGDLRFIILQMAEEFQAAGITVNCAPVLDVLTDDTHEAIGDRAFSKDPKVVARLGLSVCRNLLSAGITPVVKHMPGHGRAGVDSHHDLPVVDANLDELEENDFQPFRQIAQAPLAPGVWGMSAHIIYNKIDPDHPASVSPHMISEVIRKHIGFKGFLVSDDLDMKALERYGDIAARTQATLKAGCDSALYCAGKLKDMEKIAESVPNLHESALERLQKAAEFTKLAA